MCERRTAFAALLALIVLPAAAEEPAPQVTLLDLPFAVKAMRGPDSEVALAVSTSGLMPVAKPRAATADPRKADSKKADKADETDPAQIAAVWGEGGGAVLSLAEGAIRTTLLGAEAVEGLAAAETPRVAVPGSRRAQAGPISAYFTGPLRATGQAAALTIRERQPLGVTAEPKPVPVATATVSPGPDMVFAARRPRIATLDGKPVILAVTLDAQGSSALAVLAKTGGESGGKNGDQSGDAWAIVARTPPQFGGGRDGAPLAPVAVADFAGTGRPQIAAIREPDGAGVLQIWSLADHALTLVHEAPGYAGAGAADDADLAAAILPAKDGPADLALPVADRSALALVSLKGGIRERARITLPAPAATGVAALGRGDGAHLLVGLADGRVAVVSPASGARP